MKLREFLATVDHPIMCWISGGTARRVAILYPLQGDDDASTEWHNATGTIVNGEWQWDGNGNLKDSNQNHLRSLRVYSDKEEWTFEKEDYDLAFF